MRVLISLLLVVEYEAKRQLFPKKATLGDLGDRGFTLFLGGQVAVTESFDSKKNVREETMALK